MTFLADTNEARNTLEYRFGSTVFRHRRDADHYYSTPFESYELEEDEELFPEFTADGKMPKLTVEDWEAEMEAVEDRRKAKLGYVPEADFQSPAALSNPPGCSAHSVACDTLDLQTAEFSTREASRSASGTQQPEAGKPQGKRKAKRSKAQKQS